MTNLHTTFVIKITTIIKFKEIENNGDNRRLNDIL